MIFTDFIREDCMEKPSILTKEDFEHFDKLVWNDKGKTLEACMYNTSNVTLFFNKGFVIFNIFCSDIDYNDNDTICDLVCFHKARDSKLQKKQFLNKFWDFLRVNKCTKVNMFTKISPEFWIKNYGFKLKRYEMELEL